MLVLGIVLILGGYTIAYAGMRNLSDAKSNPNPSNGFGIADAITCAPARQPTSDTVGQPVNISSPGAAPQPNFQANPQVAPNPRGFLVPQAGVGTLSPIFNPAPAPSPFPRLPPIPNPIPIVSGFLNTVVNGVANTIRGFSGGSYTPPNLPTPPNPISGFFNNLRLPRLFG